MQHLVSYRAHSMLFYHNLDDVHSLTRSTFFSQSTCSTCSGGDNPDACTMMACEPCSTCEDGDEVYCSGVSYLASDGCNRCTCGENGLSACTMMACPEPPTPDVMPEVMTKEEDTTSGAISASIGLSTIAVFLSFLGGTVMY